MRRERRWWGWWGRRRREESSKSRKATSNMTREQDQNQTFTGTGRPDLGPDCGGSGGDGERGRTVGGGGGSVSCLP